MVVRLETLQEQASMLHDSLKAQELDSLRLLGPRLDKMSQCHQESVGALRTELQRLEGILSSPAPTLKSDLQKIFQEMEDLNGKLHILNQVQIQDQNDFHEVDKSQKEFSQRMNDEMALLRGKVSLMRVDEFITRQEAKLQQLFEVGNQYSAVQQCVDDLRVEIGSVRGDLDVLITDKVLKYMRSIPSVLQAGV